VSIVTSTRCRAAAGGRDAVQDAMPRSAMAAAIVTV
jgi:hypothetical protein